RFSIILNGEIYNYRELRRDLESGGRRFRTGSDTEVLLNAYAEWGIDCLQRLNGMFAFAIWDDSDKELLLVRDRAGIKPLYYALAGLGLAFASEIKAILATKLVAPEIDLEALNQCLTFLWPVPPHTLFKGISQLLPGHLLRVRDGVTTVEQWWDLDYSAEESGGNGSDWAELVLETLDRVTKLEMVADVPLGAFLSGGVDSSLLVALMSRHSKQKISTYTTGISAGDLSFDIIPDDVKWSRRVAELLPVDYHETILTPDVADLLPKLVWHQEAPIIDMAIPTYLISEQARRTQTVMLSGMGGDEVFAGYPRQMAMHIARVTDLVPTAVRRPLMRTIERVLPGGGSSRLTAPMRNAKKFARSASADFEGRYLGYGTYFTNAMKQGLYSADLGPSMGGFDAYRYHRDHLAHARDWSPLNRLLYLDFKTFMPALNMDTTDKQAMAVNLEVRTPYLNKEIVELSQRIPAGLKLAGLKRKYVLKLAAESLLPREVIWRRKAGFGAPIRSWLRGPLRPLIDDLLSPDRVRRRGLFQAEAVGRVISDFESGREDFSLHLFQLLTLEMWFELFID
ncbi:MAG TPA: asparagine synthase (glutamine-hydrolyzing), partial [Pyrinomonadaceae bacterium]|nr:asparagine synthase (glutamine-hydrolyzing) [Pyrinomonadaceae bacterium]